MKRTALGLTLILLSLCVSNRFDVLAGCGDTWQKYMNDTTNGSCGPMWGDVITIEYIKHWRIF